jgi:hypothetical protein
MKVMKKQCEAFGETHQVEVHADFITSVGSKNILTIAAEHQAKVGHDVRQFPGRGAPNAIEKKGPCGRISVLKDAAALDVMEMYPAGANPSPDAENWAYEAILTATRRVQPRRRVQQPRADSGQK